MPSEDLSDFFLLEPFSVPRCPQLHRFCFSTLAGHRPSQSVLVTLSTSPARAAFPATGPHITLESNSFGAAQAIGAPFTLDDKQLLFLILSRMCSSQLLSPNCAFMCSNVRLLADSWRSIHAQGSESRYFNAPQKSVKCCRR